MCQSRIPHAPWMVYNSAGVPQDLTLIWRPPYCELCNWGSQWSLPGGGSAASIGKILPGSGASSSPMKRNTKNWQNYSKPSLNVTLLQTQYFDSFFIRWIRNICINFLLKIYTCFTWQNAAWDPMNVRQWKNCMGSNMGGLRSWSILQTVPKHFSNLHMEETSDSVPLRSQILLMRARQHKNLKSKVRPDLDACLLWSIQSWTGRILTKTLLCEKKLKLCSSEFVWCLFCSTPSAILNYFSCEWCSHPTLRNAVHIIFDPCTLKGLIWVKFGFS